MAVLLGVSVLPVHSHARAAEYCANCGNMGETTSIAGQTLYSNMDSGNHCKWVGTVKKFSCCGYTIAQKRDFETYEPHSYNSKGVCVCGAKGTPSAPKPCDHGGTLVYDYEYKTTYSYAQYSASQHIKYTIGRDICPCGAVVNESKWESYENHSYFGDKCSQCGASKGGGSGSTQVPPTATPAPEGNACNHQTFEQVLSTHYLPSTAERHTVRKTVLIACKCGQIKRQETKNQVALHEFDGNGLCKCGYQQGAAVPTPVPGQETVPPIPSHRYLLSLTNAQYYTGENHEKIPYVTEGDVDYVYVTDLDSPDDLRNLAAADLHIETNENCSNTGLMINFHTAGGAEIYLVRTSTGERLATLTVGVTVLLVEDSGWHYEDFYTNIVQLKDMESINWKSKSLMVANNVFINDFEMDNHTVKFEAYNGSTMIYAVVSYDENGNEIERKYIEGYDATTGMIESAYTTLAATGRIFDTKMGNDADTKRTNVELLTVPGGKIRFLQPDEDIDLWAINFAELLIRSLDVMKSAKDAATPMDIDLVEELLKKLGKEEIGEIAKNILIRKYGTPELLKAAFVDGYLFKEFFNSQNLLDLYIKDFTVNLLEHAQKLGIALAKETATALEDVAMLALASASGGTTIVLNRILKGAQLLVDGVEVERLMHDFNACMQGEDYVGLDSIVLPLEDYDAEAAPVYGAPTGLATVRTGPGTHYNVLGVASPKEALVILDTVPGEDTLKPWYKVRYNGQIGYVSSGMMEIWD